MRLALGGFVSIARGLLDCDYYCSIDRSIGRISMTGMDTSDSDSDSDSSTVGIEDVKRHDRVGYVGFRCDMI